MARMGKTPGQLGLISAARKISGNLSGANAYVTDFIAVLPICHHIINFSNP